MNTLKYLTIITLFTIAGTSCKKTSEPAAEVEETSEFVQIDQYTKKYKNGVIEVNYLPVDTTRKTSEMYDYYNFESSKMVAADQVLTDKWDIAFSGRLSSSVRNNFSKVTTNNLPWKNPDGIVEVSFVNLIKNFDEVNEITADMQFLSQAGSAGAMAIGTVSKEYHINVPGIWGYSVINQETQTMEYSLSYNNRTTIFKLNDGRYVKFQFINNYNNKPEENSINSKRGALSFRYFIAKKGSTDLKTK